MACSGQARRIAEFASERLAQSVDNLIRVDPSDALLAEERAGKRGLRQFFYSIKKEGDIFQAQDRAIDDFWRHARVGQASSFPIRQGSDPND